MAKMCEKCGSPIGDGEKFCTVCGTPVAAKKIEANRFCVQCGNLLKEGAKFCEVCGREVPAAKHKAVEPVKAEPATMDEIVVPTIDASTFAGAREISKEKFDGFEAAVMPENAMSQPTAPPPVPEFAMDSAVISGDKPKPKPAPQPVQAQARPAAVTAQARPAQQGAAPNIRPQSNQPAYRQAMQQTDAYQQAMGQSQPQPTPQPGRPAYDPGAPIPTMNANGQPENKGGVPIVPIILALLIVAVIVADIFLFVVKKDDSKDDKADKDIAQIVTILDE